jgi:hypothetical protein
LPAFEVARQLLCVRERDGELTAALLDRDVAVARVAIPSGIGRERQRRGEVAFRFGMESAAFDSAFTALRQAAVI